MQISMRMTVIFAAVFALICFGVAITGFSSLGDIADPAQRDDGRGFALFWTFLGVVATFFGTRGWWILKKHKGES